MLVAGRRERGGVRHRGAGAKQGGGGARDEQRLAAAEERAGGSGGASGSGGAHKFLPVCPRRPARASERSRLGLGGGSRERDRRARAGGAGRDPGEDLDALRNSDAASAHPVSG